MMAEAFTDSGREVLTAPDGGAALGLRDGAWFLDLNGNGLWDGCSVDACAGFGLAGDEPVVGNW